MTFHQTQINLNRKLEGMGSPNERFHASSNHFQNSVNPETQHITNPVAISLPSPNSIQRRKHFSRCSTTHQIPNKKRKSPFMQEMNLEQQLPSPVKLHAIHTTPMLRMNSSTQSSHKNQKWTSSEEKLASGSAPTELTSKSTQNKFSHSPSLWSSFLPSFAHLPKSTLFCTKILLIYLLIVVLSLHPTRRPPLWTGTHNAATHSPTIFSSFFVPSGGLVSAASGNIWTRPSEYNIRYKGRRWYLSGQFSELYNDMERLDGKEMPKIENRVVPANNVAYYDGSQFHSMGNGTNGEVFELQIDSCLNVFAGGNFTHVSNGVEGEEPLLTGPIAKWNSLRERWESLLDEYNHDEYNDLYKKENRAYWLEGHENKVYTISTDCWRMPTNMLDCQCDVYIGGSFVLMFADGRNATNIARWDADSKQWDDLGGPLKSGINDVNKPVRSVWRTDVNINIVAKALWVGGEFDGYLKKRMLRYSDQSWSDIPEINGPVYSVTYQFNTLGRDFLTVGGDFNFTSSDNGGVRCTYLCTYNLYEEYAGWLPPIMDNNHTITAPVTSVAFLDVNNYYFLTLEQPFIFVSEYNHAYITESFETSLNSIAACTNFDLACRRGSITVLGEGNFVRFYDSARRSWHVIGDDVKVTDGRITQLESIYQGAGGWSIANQRFLTWKCCLLCAIGVIGSILFGGM